MSDDTKGAGKKTRADRKAAKEQKRTARKEREASRSIPEHILRALVMPVAPWRTTARTLSSTGIANEVGMLRRGISARRKCPKCNSAISLGEVVDNEGDDATHDESYRAFLCNSCGWHESVDDALTEAKGALSGFKSSEKQCLYYGLGIFLLFSIISFMNGSIFTFLGGAVIGFSLLSFALFYRYRYWQVVNQRLFETQPPVAEWLRDEMASKG